MEDRGINKDYFINNYNTMNPIVTMQEKFLILAQKLWLDSSTLDQIKKWFTEKLKNVESKADTADDKKEWETAPEGTVVDEKEDKAEGESDATESKDKAVVKVDIAKPTEERMPTEEDLSKMNQEELLAFAKKMVNKENNPDKPEEPKVAPFAVMVKRQGY